MPSATATASAGAKCQRRTGGAGVEHLQDRVVEVAVAVEVGRRGPRGRAADQDIGARLAACGVARRGSRRRAPACWQRSRTPRSGRRPRSRATPERALPCVPSVATLTRSVKPVSRSCTKTSAQFWLRGPVDVVEAQIVAVVRHEIAGDAGEGDVAAVGGERQAAACRLEGRAVGLRAIRGHAHPRQRACVAIVDEDVRHAVGVAGDEVGGEALKGDDTAVARDGREDRRLVRGSPVIRSLTRCRLARQLVEHADVGAVRVKSQATKFRQKLLSSAVSDGGHRST